MFSIQNVICKSNNNSIFCSTSKDLQSQDANQLLDDLYVAIKTGDKNTARQYYEALTKKIDKTNVLDCLLGLTRRSNNACSNSYQPSAPTEDTKENQNEDWKIDLEDNLRNICLSVIDKNGDFVLKDERMLLLSFNDLQSVTTRDTLEVSNELVVYSAVVRWGRQQQRKRTQNGEVLDLRDILGDLVYSPR